MKSITRSIGGTAAVASALILTGLAGPLAAQTTYTPYQFVTIAGTPGSSGSSDGTGSAARFSLPRGIAVDGSGNLYVVDTNNETVRKITPGGVVTTIAGAPGVAGAAVVGVSGSATRFHYPSGIAVDTSGNFVLVADTQNEGWQGLVPSTAGGVTTWSTTNVGSFSSFYSAAAGIGGSINAISILPIGVAVNSTGSYGYGSTVGASTGAGVIDEAFSGTYAPAVVAGNLSGSTGSTNASGGAASFNNPEGVALDGSGNIYVADNGNDMVRVVTPTVGAGGTQNVVTTMAGMADVSGSADGTGTAAKFNGLSSVAVDANGNVFVADTGNNTIRKITPGGVVTTVAGVPGAAGSADGTGSAARFNQPYGIAVDSSGNLYVTDSGSNTIREGLAPSVAPTFTLAASPSTATIGTGRTVVFNAVAAGTPAPTYQWTLNGSTTIPGATVTNDPILVIGGSTAADDGTIACTATNTAGSVSSSGTLSVITTTTPGYLDNLAGRAFVGSGASNALFGGFGISGTGTKQLLIRGMGPSLLPGYIFTVSDALLDTQLTLYNNNSVAIASNSPWGGTAALMAADSLVGAYPPVSTASLDSMLYVSVGTGPSSASIAGVNGDTGDAVIEIYDADPLPLAATLTNLAVRAPVGTGNDILFGGFAIGGTTEETVLIRAIGPGLAIKFPTSFTPSQVLAQPVLTLYAGSTPIYSNTVWGGDQALVNAMNTVGAYQVPTSTADSLLLVTLPPGGYSAEISGLNNTTGIAVVEVYEVQ